MSTINVNLIQHGDVFKTPPLPTVADNDDIVMQLPSGVPGEGVAQFLGCWSTTDGISTGNPSASFSNAVVDIKNHTITFLGMVSVVAGNTLVLVIHFIGLP